MNRICCLVIAIVLVLGNMAIAGGPLAVGGPTTTIDGQPFVWDASAFPIRYRVDSGPLSSTVTNTAGLTRVQNMFNNWQVPTASITYSYTGPILSTGAFAGGDVKTLAQFDAVSDSCQSGTQNPIIFDADGSLVAALGLDTDVIGFASPCALSPATGHILSGFAVLNGQFQDGVNSDKNFELTAAQFDEAITHELGHFSGLDHSQINLNVLFTQWNNCPADSLAGLPLMFPFAFCQARSSAGLPTVAPDDVAWISKLYPSASFATTYGTISGLILFSDGFTHAQGVNVIARRVDDPNTPQNESLTRAFSVVSGYLFTGNPGQSLTGTNTGGDKTGSRSPQLIGYYEIPVPAGTYTVEVESIYSAFTSGSGVGPLDPPVPMPGGIPKFWNSHQTPINNPQDKETITISPGQTIHGINIILNGTQPRFDQFEDGGADIHPPSVVPVRGEAVNA